MRSNRLDIEPGAEGVRAGAETTSTERERGACRARATAGSPWRTALVVATLALPIGALLAEPDADMPWQRVEPANDRGPTPRHESGLAAAAGRLWLMGGRGTRPVETFFPGVDSWREAGGGATDNLHHFQPAVIGSSIYVLGAFTGGYPDEDPVAEIRRYDSVGESWSVVGEIPAGRRRGSAATAVHDGWIYLVGGNTLGHNGGAVPWFDRWNPSTGVWETLGDAPHARDHFMADFVDGKLVAAGGRATDRDDGTPFNDAVGPTDVYDPDSDSWSTAAAIPTLRAGTLAVGRGTELIVVGGEIDTATTALAHVEAFDVRAGTWRRLQDLNVGRHSGGGAVLGDVFHVIAGSDAKGGGGETDVHETLDLRGRADPDTDADGDGLSDRDETDVYGTDPTLADTDGDTLDDGDEVARGTDPTLADTDADGLDDGEEVAFGSSPTEADSDQDGLDDARERESGTAPLDPDDDDDGLSDGDEVDVHGTDPLRADTDGDTLDDAAELELGTSPLAADTDEDGLDDGDEEALGTSPVVADTDDDGLLDGDEMTRGTSPLDPDTDADSLDDGAEVALGTDPLDADTDGDGIDDAEDDDPLSAPGERKKGGGAAGPGWLLFGAVGMFIRRVRAGIPVSER